MASAKSISNQRKTPVQDRAKATYNAILQAAAQILDADGQATFTSNHIAARAGVSIGSLYQYFPNKQAILLAIAENEEKQLPQRPDLERQSEAQSKSSLRLGLRAYINMLPKNPKARKAALMTVLRERGPIEVARLTDERFAQAGAFAELSQTERFVLSRAIVGVVQSAVQEERTDIASLEFENTLVRLARSFVKACA